MSFLGFDFTSMTSTSNNSNIISTSTLNVDNPTYTYTTSTLGNTLGNEKLNLKLCRHCDHAHLNGQSGCIAAFGSMVYLASCQCKEYVPLDNLEYLEYLSEKKESK